METPWQELLALHGLIGLFVIVWSLAENRLSSGYLARARINPGFILGLVAVTTMTMAVEVRPGFHFDLRHALIATSGFLFGPLSGLVTGLMAATLRIYLGGVGLEAGLAGIAASTLVGAVAYHLSRGRTATFVQGFHLAIATTLGAMASLLVIPAEPRAAILAVAWLPLVALTFSSTLFTHYLIALEIARRKERGILQLYRDMVDAFPDCLNAKDAAGNFIVANRATADLMKATNTEALIDRSDFDFYPASVAAGYREQELAVMAGDQPQRFEQLVDFKDGKLGWLETVKVPLKNRDGHLTALMTYNRDTTDVRELNMRKEQFIATMSHEIRTPLTAICGSLRLVASGVAGALPAKAADMIARADRNAQNLSELINNLLDIEKLNSGQMDFTPEVVDMGKLASEVIDSMKHFLPSKNLAFRLSGQNADASVLVHPVRLRQVLLNLLSNAAKYAPAASTIEVEIVVEGDCVRLCVLDEGPGVQPEFEAALFRRFHQEKATADLNTANGTGIGLSLIKSFVEHMSGQVSYRRRQNRTEFRIELPRIAANRRAA